MKTDVRGFRGENGHVTSVVLDNGTEIKADLVIIGAGVAPTTTFLKDSGIELDYSGGVVADPFL
jgi:NADPH-dependent 2,4-dienoyl-CoA reductase/sulfur reductase-like enzyme